MAAGNLCVIELEVGGQTFNMTETAGITAGAVVKKVQPRIRLDDYQITMLNNGNNSRVDADTKLGAGEFILSVVPVAKAKA